MKSSFAIAVGSRLAIAVAGCSKSANDCNYTGTCGGTATGGGTATDSGAGGTTSHTGGTSSTADAGGAGGTLQDSGTGTGGTDASTTGGAAGCSSTCTGNTPLCNATAHSCVECMGDAGCTGSKPLCTSSNMCVECLTNSDCADASASLCISGTCSHCTQDADCSHIAGKAACKTVAEGDAGAATGTCVQCTVQNESPCGSNSCNPATNACTSTPRASLDVCHACVADSECMPVDIGDGGTEAVRCVPMTFNGAARGGYCLERLPASSVCPRPYTVVFAATSASGAAADQYCGINQSATTCEAVLDLQASKSCSLDSECGNGQGGLCRTITGVGLVCTIPCDLASQCPSSLACTTGLPYCH
jgi:hypothetical protein